MNGLRASEWVTHNNKNVSRVGVIPQCNLIRQDKHSQKWIFMYALLVSHALTIEHEKSVSLPLSQWLKIFKNVTYQNASEASYVYIFQLYHSGWQSPKIYLTCWNSAFFDMRHFWVFLPTMQGFKSCFHLVEKSGGIRVQTFKMNVARSALKMRLFN